MRYAFVALAKVWPWLNGALPPSRRRQTVCVVQITTLIVCLGPVVPPLLASALAAFGLARSGQLFVRAVGGMALGFAFFVVDNAALALGNFGGYTPFLAAWSPFVLFALIGETVLIRTEE